MNLPFRVGFGYDVHPFEENRKLILGGIEIPYHLGLKGHSDADALLHAITDAVLGAVSLGDIGAHFPDTDEKYKGADSKVLLKEAYKLVLDKNYKIGNIDVTVVLEKPKLRPFISDMCKSVAAVLDIDVSQVSIKATTEEKMGFVGEGKGIKVYSVVLLFKDEN